MKSPVKPGARRTLWEARKGQWRCSKKENGAARRVVKASEPTMQLCALLDLVVMSQAKKGDMCGCNNMLRADK